MPAGPYALHNDQHAYSAYGYGGEKSPSAAAAAAGYQAPLNGAADESANSILQSVKEQVHVIALCSRNCTAWCVAVVLFSTTPDRSRVLSVFAVFTDDMPWLCDCTVARYIWFMHEMITECKCFSTNHYCMYVYLN